MQQAAFDAALARHQAGDLSAAEAGYRAVLAAGDHVAALQNLASILAETGRPQAGLPLLERAAQLRPDFAQPWLNLASLRLNLGDPSAAEAAVLRAMALDPEQTEGQALLANARLALGRLPQAWEGWEARETRRTSAAQKLPFPEWRGEPLAGKRLLIWREQGFGDQIQMARFIPQLGAAQVVYAGPAALQRLLGQLPLRYEPVGPGRNAVPACDLWTLPLSLPSRLRITFESLPAAPYLKGVASSAPGRIGLVWRGNALPDPGRSLDPEAGHRLSAAIGAVSLHPDDTRAADFQDTADRIAGLDLVISVDTSVAHLAGAMGKPVWLLLPAYRADPRWMCDRADSPWYPSMRIFRQPRIGDWDAVVEAVLAALSENPER
jgi:hypothetical protein